MKEIDLTVAVAERPVAIIWAGSPWRIVAGRMIISGSAAGSGLASGVLTSCATGAAAGRYKYAPRSAKGMTSHKTFFIPLL